MPTPAYKKEDFIQACCKGAVHIWDKALQCANEEFGLRTAKDLLNFICNEGLVGSTLDNSRSFENWTGKSPAPLVDSYCFSTGSKKGYIAFYKGVNSWILKSFKRDMKKADLNMPFAGLAQLLVDLKPEGETK